MSIVICKLPKAGLGNQLFPLLKAYSFAHLNKLPVLVTGYNQVFLGPYLRREKSKRNYTRIFIFQKNSFSALRNLWQRFQYRKHIVEKEPVVQQLPPAALLNRIYQFAEMPHWDHYFDGLKENRQLVIDLLWKLIVPAIKNKVLSSPPPCIGIHIRMGDFRQLRPGEEYGKYGAVRAPEQYYIDLVNTIRDIHGSDLPVSVFTDGYPQEFAELFQLKNIQLVEGNKDMEDLLVLSRSKIIITSAGSTFSYWSAFLSDAIVIMHPLHVQTVIRLSNPKKWFEGALEINNTFLTEAIREIIH